MILDNFIHTIWTIGSLDSSTQIYINPKYKSHKLKFYLLQTFDSGNGVIYNFFFTVHITSPLFHHGLNARSWYVKRHFLISKYEKVEKTLKMNVNKTKKNENL